MHFKEEMVHFFLKNDALRCESVNVLYLDYHNKFNKFTAIHSKNKKLFEKLIMHLL